MPRIFQGTSMGLTSSLFNVFRPVVNRKPDGTMDEFVAEYENNIGHMAICGDLLSGASSVLRGLTHRTKGTRVLFTVGHAPGWAGAGATGELFGPDGNIIDYVMPLADMLERRQEGVLHMLCPYEVCHDEVHPFSEAVRTIVSNELSRGTVPATSATLAFDDNLALLTEPLQRDLFRTGRKAGIRIVFNAQSPADVALSAEFLSDCNMRAMFRVFPESRALECAHRFFGSQGSDELQTAVTQMATGHFFVSGSGVPRKFVATV